MTANVGAGSLASSAAHQSAIQVVVKEQPDTHPRWPRLDVKAASRVGPSAAPEDSTRDYGSNTTGARVGSGRLVSNSRRVESLTFGATPDEVSPGPGALKATAYAFGSASNHRSTSARRQPTARDPRASEPDWRWKVAGTYASPQRRARQTNQRQDRWRSQDCRRGITGSAWWYVGNRLSAQRTAGRSFRRWSR